MAPYPAGDRDIYVLFNLQKPVSGPLFAGDIITELDRTILSGRFAIENSFTGKGSNIYDYRLQVIGTGPVPPAPTPESSTRLLTLAGLTVLLAVRSRTLYV
jgi:hypothetical protein